MTSFGLDFGTSHLRVSSHDDAAHDLAWPGASPELPVALLRKKDGTFIYGKKAATQLVLSPSQGAARLKRLLGIRAPVPYKRSYPYAFVTSKKDTAKLHLGDEDLRLEVLCGDLLRHAVDTVDGEFPDAALTISVPDHLSHNQRLALLHALEQAGIGCHHLLDDSLAAWFGVNDRRLRGRRVLVVSLGAAYGSVAMVTSQGKVVEILSSLPVFGLVGDELDWNLAGILKDRFKAAVGQPPHESPDVLGRLLDAARSAREELSAMATAAIELPYLMAKDQSFHDFRGSLSRDDFAPVLETGLKELRETVKQVITESRTLKSDIAAVILCGGVSRTPPVQETLGALERPLLKAYQHGSLFARGAALYGQTSRDERGFRAYEVTCSDLYLHLPNKETLKIVPRGTPRPYRKEFTFDPEADKWPSHMVTLAQGIETPTAKPPLLGTYPLRSITGARAGGKKVSFEVEEDRQGVVTLHLREEDQNATITPIEESFKQQESSGKDSAKFDVGEKIGDKFEVLEHIGSGGFSFIYKVRNLGSGDVEALKILRTEYNLDGVVLERFRRSAEQLLKIKHPNIGRVFNFFNFKGLYIIHQEFIEGEDLEVFFEQKKVDRLSLEERVDLLIAILKALRDLRDHHILHADLKPQNIMIRTDNTPKLIDFELSKFLKLEPLADEMVTGTPKYFSPEHIASKQAFGEYSDIYSLGLIGYRLLTGTFPKKEHKPDADYMFSILELGKDIRPIPPHKVNRKIALDLSNALIRAVRMSRKERYQTYEEFLAELAPFGTEF